MGWFYLLMRLSITSVITRLIVVQTCILACRMAFSVSWYKADTQRLDEDSAHTYHKTTSSKRHHSGSAEIHITLMLEVVTTWWDTSCHKAQIPLCTWHFFFFLSGQTENGFILCSLTKDGTTTFRLLSRYQSSFSIQRPVTDAFLYILLLLLSLRLSM